MTSLKKKKKNLLITLLLLNEISASSLKVLTNTVQCSMSQYFTLLYNIVQCQTEQCSTKQCCTVL